MKYEVILKEIEIYKLQVEAENEDDAIDKAWEIFTDGGEKNKATYHNDSDGDSEAYEI